MIVRSQIGVRRGLSLLEVIISLAIFLFSLVAISRLIDAGVDQAVELDLKTQAALIAQTKIAEVTAGALPLTSQGETDLDEDSNWTWKLDAEADSIPGLFRVKVTVSRQERGMNINVVMSQLVLDPTKRGGTDATAIGTDDPNATNTTGTTTGGTP